MQSTGRRVLGDPHALIMPAITWTQDRPEDDRLYYFALPTGVTNPPLVPESRMSRMRFVGNWDEAAAMGAFRSVDSESAPADLPDILVIWWPSIMTTRSDRPQRALYFEAARRHITELEQARSTDRRAWWELLGQIRESASDTVATPVDPPTSIGDWTLPSPESDPG